MINNNYILYIINSFLVVMLVLIISLIITTIFIYSNEGFSSIVAGLIAIIGGVTLLVMSIFPISKKQ